MSYSSFNKKSLFVRLVVALIFLSPAAGANVSAQTDQTTATSRETLLNGLHVIFAPRAGENQVVFKLRVEGGATFDLAGKEGSMALLGDTLFPDAATRQLISEEFGGRLDVKTTYDGLFVTLSGRAENFKTLFELWRSALLNPLPSQDVLTKLIEARRQKLLEQVKNPAYVADRAINARLYGDYPYGRPIEGTPDSLARITRGDLLSTRERFLNPNNAIFVIAGNFDEKYARTAVRQFLGVWRKSERDIPATFRQPELPNAQLLIVNLPDGENVEMRLAARGFARNDKDRVAADVLAHIAQIYRNPNITAQSERSGAADSSKGIEQLNFQHDAYRLAGVFAFRAQTSKLNAMNLISLTNEKLQHLLKPQSDESLLDSLKYAKRRRQSELAKLNDASTLNGLAEILLNEAAGEISLADEYRAIDALTLTDIARVAQRLLQNFPQAIVAVGDAEPLRAAFNKVQFEITDPKSFIASLSPAPTAATNANSNIRPLTSLSPKPNKSTDRQLFPLPKATLLPTPSPTPTPPKKP